VREPTQLLAWRLSLLGAVSLAGRLTVLSPCLSRSQVGVSMRAFVQALFPFLLAFCGLSCSSSGDGGDDGAGGDSDAVPTVDMSFERIAVAGLDQVTVRVTVDGSSAVPSLAVDHGSLSDPVADGASWLATLTPDTTGEYVVSASLGAGSASRTALVLQDVAAGWGQPEAVAGLVNSSGYEDGSTISPDGRYLFVQYGPYGASGLVVFNTERANDGAGGNRLSPTVFSHPWVDETLGPTAAPQRPYFPMGRIDGTTNLHNAASWGVGIGGSPILAWSTIFYGFERQADGSFGAPFTVAFDDLNDGIINPFGLGFQPLGGDDYRTVFALKDSFTTDLGFDLYHCDISAGANTNLGTYVTTTPNSPPARGAPFASSLVDLGDNSGTQGNNFLELDSGGAVRAIWTDDEYDNDPDTHKLSVHVINSGSFPGTNDYTSLVLPNVVNVPDTEAIQPCLEGDGLFFTQDTSVAFAAYAGDHDAAGYATPGNWTAPVVILQKDTGTGPLDAADIGKVVAMGESTLAVIDGHRVLFFVYARVRGIDPITGIADLDFQIGQVQELAAALLSSG
jgi:hypothetical protein